jgi:hypothetical protein
MLWSAGDEPVRLLEPVFLLPAQWSLPAYDGGWLARLSSAVLGRAFLDLVGEGVSKCRTTRAQARLAAEAAAWFAAEVDEPCSFVFCCHVLDVEPAALRAAVLRATAHASEQRR